MAVYLDEDMVGYDAGLIGFPHLLLCMGFVIRTNNDLWGVHLTGVDASASTFAEFWQWCSAKGLLAGTITDIYGCANHKIRYGTTSAAAGINAWKSEMGGFANVMGYHGEAHGFDTSIIHPKDGTYVEYRHQNFGNQSCRIFYKRNEKTHEVGNGQLVNYNGGTSNIAKVNKKHGGFNSMAIVKVGVAGNTSFFHTGKIHEVDYASRLTTVQV
ncbi:hypothetical protein [Acidiphilium multivorum]|uniref:hypothetical protein n=1 Tax=Acidiphilium multivorum TaxID=62140 RepID=UPI001B8D12AA|nr:hypothetical protein [Acidiphilium multivorum]MBS3024223.1 hypothetical protein [Acidiphilium multivorum]